MPGSFAPREREGKRDKKRPEERRSADAVARDIKRSYLEKKGVRETADTDTRPAAVEKRKDAAEKVAASIGRQYKEKKARELSDTISSDTRLPDTPRERHGRSESQETRVEERDDRASLKKYKVRMYTPEIRGQRLNTEAELRNTIDRELPGMKHLPNFEKIMDDAVAHMQIRNVLQGKETITIPEIRLLAKEHDIPMRTARKWTYDNGMPKLYQLAETAITKSEASDILERFGGQNNGISDYVTFEKRLSNHYLGADIKESARYSKSLGMVKKYFKYCGFLAEGGVPTDIARRAGISALTGTKWNEGVVPTLLKQVREMPKEQPREGWAWLPTKIGRDGVRFGFIEVPHRIEAWKDVEWVLNQLESIKSETMNAYSSRFGIISKSEAFMHSLGVIISDGNLRVSKYCMTRMTLPLSKKYDWSETLGQATCYHMGLLGISMSRKKDWMAPNNIVMGKSGPRRITGPGFRVWRSESSPLQTWVRRTCLGLSDNENKIDVSVNIAWAIHAPREHRIALFQGIADGDGFVSVNPQEVALATQCNFDGFQKLLSSLGIESISTPKEVLIKRSNSIILAGEIGVFRYASSRKKNLEELRTIVLARKLKPSGSRLSPHEIEFACNLREKGLSYGAITRSVFHEFGMSWDISTIEHAIKRSMNAHKKSRNQLKANPE